MSDAPTVDPATLDVAYLAYFTGLRVNELVLERLHAAGFAGLRESHGFVFQHLLAGVRTISGLAARLGVTQQGASKAVAELESLGYVERAASGDARVRHVRLSARGNAAVKRTREIRARLVASATRDLAPAALDATRATLVRTLESLGGLGAVRDRRVRAPDARSAGKPKKSGRPKA